MKSFQGNFLNQNTSNIKDERTGEAFLERQSVLHILWKPHSNWIPSVLDEHEPTEVLVRTADPSLKAVIYVVLVLYL